MKRILLMGMAFVAITACNNAADDASTADTTVYDNTETGLGTTDTGMMVDTTTMYDTMRNRDSL